MKILFVSVAILGLIAVARPASASCNINMSDSTSLGFNYNQARAEFSDETYWNDDSYCPDAPHVTCPPPGGLRTASPDEISADTNYSYMWDYRQLCTGDWNTLEFNIWPDSPSYGHFHLPFADASIGSTVYSGSLGLPCACIPSDGYGIGYGKVVSNVCQTTCPTWSNEARKSLNPHLPDQWIFFWADQNESGWEGDGEFHYFLINSITTLAGSPVDVWVEDIYGNWYEYVISANATTTFPFTGMIQQAYLTTPPDNYDDMYGGIWQVSNINVTAEF